MMNLNLPASGKNGGIKIQEVSLIDNPKIVFKSDVPEEALNALAAVFIEQIEKLLETEEGKAEFEKFMKEHSDPNKEQLKQVVPMLLSALPENFRQQNRL